MARDYYCNICGKKMDDWSASNGLHLDFGMGYPSEFDEDGIELDVCIPCLDNLIRSCAISPLRSERYKPRWNFDGEGTVACSEEDSDPGDMDGAWPHE